MGKRSYLFGRESDTNSEVQTKGHEGRTWCDCLATLDIAEAHGARIEDRATVGRQNISEMAKM